MASGKTHDLVSIVMTGPVFWVSHWVFHLNTFEALVIAIGSLVGGLLLSPDLDTRSRPFYRWGPFRFIWWPYQWMIRHRSSQSHGIFLAPFFRLIYLTAVLVLLYLALTLVVETPSAQTFARWQTKTRILLNRHWLEWWLLALGIWWGGLFHWIMDGLPMGRRRR